MMLAHNVHDVQVFKRHVHANRLAGIDNEWLTPEEAKAFCPILNIAPDIRYPDPRRGAAAARRHGAARRGRLGLCARRPRARRRHHPELRGDRHPPRRRRARSPASRRRAGFDRAPRRSASSRPGTPPSSWRWPGVRMPLESYPLQALVSRAGQAGDALRRDVQHHPRLYVAVRQGRAGDRRRHRRLHLLFARRGGLHIADAHAGGDLRACSRWSGACACCATGAASSTCTPDRSPIIGKTPVPGPVRQLRLGHRRLQGDAGLGPRVRRTRSRAASRTRSPRRSRSTASAPAG